MSEAIENQRLFDEARERVTLRTELREARGRLAERNHQLRALIARQEAERHRVADALHEQAAQTLAGVLLGLGALERDTALDLRAPKLDALRSNVEGTLHSLRSLAVGLRPPVLQLGLQAALQALAVKAREDGGCTEMTVALEGTSDLSAETQMIVYRVVEEALDALGGACSVVVRAEPAGQLVIVLDGGTRPIARERLAILRAHLGLVGGTLSATTNELDIVIRP